MKKMILSLLALLMTAATGAWAQSTTTHKVTMKSGTKDAGKWTITSGEKSTTGDKAEGLTGLSENDPVTLTYTGRLKVKSVTATHDGWNGDLSNIPASLIASDGYTVIVPDGTTLTGTLDGSTHPYKIVIPAGATVTLAGVTIEGTSVYDDAHKHAGITCEGDAVIILADNTTNTVKGFHRDYPGIYIAEGKTLIIKGGSEGTGTLTASSNGSGCGIGGGFEIACGHIDIQGGIITANGGSAAAGIGGATNGNCGNISISGGFITATGGSGAAGIGSGNHSSCGHITISGGTVTATGSGKAAGIGNGFDGSYTDITITVGVTHLTATKGGDNSIGNGSHSDGCGKVTIGCTLDSDGKPVGGTVYYDGANYLNGGMEYLWQSPLTLVNLGKLTGHYEAPNGTTLFGTLKGSEQPYKVSIADGATVTLDGVDIEGVNDANCKWAGLNCAGTATIILKDGSENTVKGFHLYYPGIFVPEGKYLTIKGGTLGNGKLTASPFDGGTDISLGAGIGGSFEDDCGAIEIQGGIITANGGYGAAGIGGSKHGNMGNITISGGEVRAKGGSLSAGIGSGFICFSTSSISITGGTVNAIGGQGGAGIGSGYGETNGNTINLSSCGKITISGGTVTATGGRRAAGIGTGSQFSGCGKITITSGVDHVTAKKGTNAFNSIGLGRR